MTDAIAYIEARVQFEPNTGCWLWERGSDVDGYGRVGSTRANRVSFCAYSGVDPGPLHVLHRCDTPACVNPAHLRLGTHKQNMEDCSAKGHKYAGRDGHDIFDAIAEKAAATAMLKRLWDAVAAYGAIGHEGSHLLEVMGEARAMWERATPLTGAANVG